VRIAFLDEPATATEVRPRGARGHVCRATVEGSRPRCIAIGERQHSTAAAYGAADGSSIEQLLPNGVC